MTINDLKQYEVLDEHNIPDVASMGYVLCHKKSGARIAVLSNNDENKVFYIGFRTTPDDETGVPHIIEHTTLCGSEKFPVKDPFIELAKGSLNTFLNAMTYPDKTMYPIGSCNDQDFKNLMDVYMDAVFNPNITKYKEIFKQEGWHFELESKDAPITINGVVYNEMKGAYSSADEVLSNQIYRSLFPDNTYSKDSGGNPVHIPELTYEKYLDFYHKYYHPSNSYIYLYGDMDIVERLKWLDEEYLSKYDYMEVDSQIKPQKAFDKVKYVESEYSIASDDPEENKTYLSYNRVVADSLDQMLYQAFDVLDYALVSAPGAPVKKALIEAGIGEDVYGSYDAGILQPVFSIVAKNANVSDAEKFNEIITDTLKEIVKNGINKEALLAGININEFKFREADFGQFPKGLLFGLNCMDSWLFDDLKPFIHLECLDTFAKLRDKINTGYFEELIQKYLLDNTHGSEVVVKPARNKNAQEEQKLADKLKAYKDSLSDEEIQKLIDDTISLRKYQEEPSLDEDLRKLPMLKRSDLKREALGFSNIKENLSDVTLVRHEIESNGIDYITLMFDVNDMDPDDLGYFGFFNSVFGYVNTKEYSYIDLSNAINIYTGGINSGVSLYTDVSDKDALIFKYEIKIKVLEKNLSKALFLTDEMINNSDYSDIKRLTEIVSRVKARLQVNLSSAGHYVAAMRSMSSFSRNALYRDKIKGVGFYRSICEIEKQLKNEPQAVVDKLKSISDKIFARNRLLVSFTGNKTSYGNAKAELNKFILKLNENSPVGAIKEVKKNIKTEAFMDASQIQYVARTGNFVEKGFNYSGALRILREILSYDYLWINVRVKGGAYGCMASFLRSGESYFVSYRDPKLRETNEIYNRIPEYVRNFSSDDHDMTKYIIGTFSAIDTPLNPEAKGERSMTAYLEGITFEQIQRERDEILNASPEDIRALAPLIESILEFESICVIGNENTIKDEADMFENIEKLYI